MRGYMEVIGQYRKGVGVLFLSLLFAACPEGEKKGGDENLAIASLLLAGGRAQTTGAGSDTETTPTAAPDTAPFNVTASPRNASVELAWSSVPNATGFKIYYATNPDVSASSFFLETSDAKYTHRELQNGISYFYRVSGTNALGEGPLSTVVAGAGPDGWTTVTDASSETLRSVRYFDGTFWAVGEYATLLKSMDGSSWEAVSFGCEPESYYLWDIGYDGVATYRVVGENGTLIKSNDKGATWSCSTLGTEYLLRRVLFTGDQWWVSGRTYYYPDTVAHLLGGSSLDGDSWKLYTHGDEIYYFDSMNDIAYRESDSTAYIIGDEGYTLQCSGTECASSSTPWQKGQFPDLLDSFNSILILDDVFYLGGYETFLRSEDFASYTVEYPGYVSFSLYYDGSKIISIGEDGRIYSTEDFQTWVRRYSGTSAHLFRMECSESDCVAVGEYGLIQYKKR